jgi:hypothetical protein
MNNEIAVPDGYDALRWVAEILQESGVAMGETRGTQREHRRVESIGP